MLVGLAAALASAKETSAAPMYTDMSTLRSSSATVVIGTVHYDPTTRWRIDVDTTLRGRAVPGNPLMMSEAPNQRIRLQDGDRVVALLDASNTLRWVGVKVAGANIETGVLHLRGFFDRDAHLVSPAMMTLAQLRTMLATGALTQTFAVTLSFPDGHGGLKPSAKHFSIVWDAVTEKGALAGFSGACLDLGAIHGFEWGEPELFLVGTCPKKTQGTAFRELRLRGKPTGVDAAGNIELSLSPEQPMMSETEYDTFVADPSIATFVTVLDVKLADGSVWHWRWGGPLVDPTGKEHPPGGRSSSLEQRGSVVVNKESADFGGVQIVITQGAKPLSIVQAVDAGAITSCALVRTTPVPCTLVHSPSIVVKK